MRMRKPLACALGLVALLGIGFGLAHADTPTQSYGQAVELRDGTGARLGGPANPISSADPNNAPFTAATQMTAGQTYPAARTFGYVCTTAGTVTLTLSGGSTISLGIAVGAVLQTLPFAVKSYTLGGGAAGTFWNLS